VLFFTACTLAAGLQDESKSSPRHQAKKENKKKVVVRKDGKLYAQKNRLGGSCDQTKGICGCDPSDTSDDDQPRISKFTDGNFCQQMCAAPSDQRYQAAGLSDGSCVDEGYTVNKGILHFGMYELPGSSNTAATGSLDVDVSASSCNAHYLVRPAATDGSHPAMCEEFCVTQDADKKQFADSRTDVQKGTCDGYSVSSESGASENATGVHEVYSKYVGKGSYQIYVKPDDTSR